MTPPNPFSIQLKPPLGRSLLSGYPGIPSTNALTPRPVDTLTPLPLLQRESASLSGSVEVRTGGKLLKAKWLRVELEKIETISANSITLAGGDVGNSNGDTKRFVELIGIEPETLWSANSVNYDGKKLSKNKEFAELREGNYDFRIPLPEGLPPTIQVDGSESGISYQLVATVYSKGKKSFFQSNPNIIYLTDKVPILLNKFDLLPTWPIYSPILRSPPLKPLDWINKNGLTTGEFKSIERSLKLARGEDGGKLRLTCYRESGSFGPGDIIRVRIDMDLEGKNAVKLTRLELSLKETITFKYADSKVSVATTTFFNPPAIVNKIFTVSPPSSTSVSAGSFLSIIYPNETTSFDLSHPLPNFHSRVTVKTGKHLEVAYSLDIKGTVESGGEIGIENWNVIIGGTSKKEALGIIKQIGYVEELCQRGQIHGEVNTSRTSNNLKNLSPRTSPPARPPPRLSNSNNLKTQSTQIPPVLKEVTPVNEEMQYDNEKSPQLRQKFIIHNADIEPDVEEESSSNHVIKAELSTSPTIPLGISEPQKALLPSGLESAESEKERLYSAAIRERDEIQKQHARRDALNSLNSRSRSAQDHSPSPGTPQVKEVQGESRKTLQEARFEILQRQEAARIELERQNSLLMALELEESRQRQIDQDKAELEEYRRRDRESRQFGASRNMQEVAYNMGNRNGVTYPVESVSRSYSRITPTAPPMDYNYGNYVEPLPLPFFSQPVDIKRSPSAASFAPSTSISHATSQFYATAIANSANTTQNPTLADEKSNYLKTLRQRDFDSKKSFPDYSMTYPKDASPLPTPPRSPPMDQKQFYASSADSYSYSYGAQPHSLQASYSQHPSQSQYDHGYYHDVKNQQFQQYPFANQASTSTPRSQYDSNIPSNYSYPQNTDQLEGFKTASQEKDELQNRMITECSSQSKKVEVEVRESEDLLPVYETRGENSSGEKPLTASEEKRELSTYDAAKAEVDAYRNRPPPNLNSPRQFEEYYSKSQYQSKPTIIDSQYELQSSPESIDQSQAQSRNSNNNTNTNSNSPEYFPPYPPPSTPLFPSSIILPSIKELEYDQISSSSPQYQNERIINQPQVKTPRGKRSDSILSESSSSISSEIHRDPSIAAGKRVVRSPSLVQYSSIAENNEDGRWRDEKK